VKIVLNGKDETLLQPMTIKELIEVKGGEPDRVVVELNLEIIGKEAWADIVLKDGDRMEILRFVGGG
jgi:sulfur carrier protein